MMPATACRAMPPHLSRRHATWLLTAGLATWAAGPARALEPPAKAVVLTIGGAIGERNRGAVAAFDLDMLRALPQVSFTTLTPWDNRPLKFTGPLLRDVLAQVRASGQVLKAHAINDYRIEIPVSDAQRYDVVLAHSIDDRPLTVRTKGPLFVVYPFQRHPELQNNTYYERSIWQLRHLEVE